MQQSLEIILNSLTLKSEEIKNNNYKILENKLLSSSDKDLTNYMVDAYLSKKNSYNFETLLLMENKTINYGIIRMKVIEDHNDLSKFFAPTVVLTLAYLTSYTTLIGKIIKYPLVASFIGLVCTAIIITVMIRFVEKVRNKKASAIYFKGLLEYTLTEKNNT